MKRKNNLYDLTLLSERIEDLRKRDGKNKITLEDLSKKIEEKTGEYISKNTLGTYENVEEAKNMKLRNLITIANFYEVSIDYLLGNTNSKSFNFIDKMTANKFSLSDKTMKRLSKLTLDKKISSNADLKLKIINFIIENYNLMDELTTKLVNYYKANDNKFKIKDEIEEKCGISTLELTRYSVIKVFEQFIDDSYEQIWHRKKSTLFEMPKSKIKRNEE